MSWSKALRERYSHNLGFYLRHYHDGSLSYSVQNARLEGVGR